MKRIKELIINLIHKVKENHDIAWLVGILLAALVCVSVSRCTDHNRYQWELLTYQEILRDKQDSLETHMDSLRVLNGRLQGMAGGHDSAIREIIRLQEEISGLKTKIRELEAVLDERQAYAKMLEDDLNDGRD